MVTFKIVQWHPGLTFILTSDIRALWRINQSINQKRTDYSGEKNRKLFLGHYTQLIVYRWK